ncbi:outer membrane beta-barrel protein [Marinobacter sp.]|uniref:outer membrane beta-barrel protein n=1 Tax=Marinobacter sp. TaxID=50741 RepID=UPI0023522706|nr:outer membrane beta-barrel protein [Marinobacter sp.]
MNKVVRTSLLAALIPATLMTTSPVFAQDMDSGKAREDMHYVGLLATAFNHRSVGTVTNEAAWGNGVTLVVGGHITDLFHAEVRAGGGITDADVPNSNLTLAIDYFASWYIGMHHPITDYANVYGQFGFSHIGGKSELKRPGAAQNRQFQLFEEDFPGSSFSVSWLVGLDIELLDNTYLAFEGGRLFEDTETEVNTFQFSGGLRYEF